MRQKFGSILEMSSDGCRVAKKLNRSAGYRLALRFALARRGRNIARLSELLIAERVVNTPPDIPEAVRRSENRDVGFVVAVIISGDRNVRAETELTEIISRIGTAPNIPDTV